ncbi:hypothetical protein IQ255_07330 [Pleurocapsales cyanobacterium LEGE 10410]|nr:hypothetical protein [Pleurocapsales cyanobacterium LEGE 10410]
MTNSSAIDKRKNKNFVINNKTLLKQYAIQNREFFGQGIIVVNLLLMNADLLNGKALFTLEPGTEPTVHQPISYIPKSNFWFKMLSLKIKKKYQIDIQEAKNFDNKFLIVFVKDASIEHFSIYSLKLEKTVVK